jgi:hypothetical protein
VFPPCTFRRVTAFDAGVQRLLNQIAHWAENRWRRPAGDGTRETVVQTLVQQLADVAADAEGQPRRPVPHLHPMVLPDQLRVMADDLAAAGPSADTLDRAAQLVEETRAKLG